jgi:hypothetical protein
MQPQIQNVSVPTPLELRDKALNLRESVNSSRARMHAHRQKIELLRVQLAELRAMVEKPMTAPAPTPKTLAPVMKEAAADSAPVAVSFKTDEPFPTWKVVPYAAIFVVGVGLQMMPGSRRGPVTAPPPAAAAATIASDPSPEPILDDGGADEALLMAHDWKLPGDERPLAERLGAGANPPGSQPEWSTERTGDRLYRVSFKPNGSDANYDFDVDLAAHRVDPTPETAELISPRLTAGR